MKALISSLLFAVAYAKFDDLKICGIGAFPCYSTQEFPKGFPKDVAGMDERCAIMTDQADCMSDLVDLCGNIFPEPEGYFRYIKNIVHKMCDKNSTLYQDLAKDIVCMENALKTTEESCNNLGQEITENAKKEKGFALYQWNKFMCLDYIVTTSCKISKIRGSCGTAAETTVLQVAKDFKGQNGICMEDSFQDAVNLLKSLNLESKLKSQIIRHLNRIA